MTRYLQWVVGARLTWLSNSWTLTSIARVAPLALSLILCFSQACQVYDPDLLQSGSGAAGESGLLPPTALDSIYYNECESAAVRYCTRPNAVAGCYDTATGRQCLLERCTGSYADCDGDDANGCEVETNTPEHCGLCNARCEFNHAEATCADGECQLGACLPGYDNCDKEPANGCERSLNALSDCGACDKQCPAVAHGTPSCEAQTCDAKCNVGWDDCNGDVEDGCEAPVVDKDNCGACGNVCASKPHVTDAVCSNAVCVVTKCAAGFADCNKKPEDGCEADLRTGSNCDVAMPAGNGAGADAGGTGASGKGGTSDSSGAGQGADQACPAGRTDCTTDAAAGCEADSSGACATDTCPSGFHDCNANAADGCEIQGACPATTPVPSEGCPAGQTACSGTCVSTATDIDNCGACGRRCSPAHGEAACNNGTCGIAYCDNGYQNCDALASNGCETSLSSAANCGGCSTNCASLPNVSSATCSGSSCSIESCKAGWADCDPTRVGCETNVSSDSQNCGACNRACGTQNGSASCVSGSCQLSNCNAGFGNCDANAANGCETTLNQADNCGACGKSCPNPSNGYGFCTGSGSCDFACNAGYTKSGSSCVASSDPNNCGGHGKCPAPANGYATCSAGTCGIACNSGYTNCNGSCVTLGTVDNCGSCGDVCSAPAGGSATCNAGSCQQSCPLLFGVRDDKCCLLSLLLVCSQP